VSRPYTPPQLDIGNGDGGYYFSSRVQPWPNNIRNLYISWRLLEW